MQKRCRSQTSVMRDELRKCHQKNSTLSFSFILSGDWTETMMLFLEMSVVAEANVWVGVS